MKRRIALLALLLAPVPACMPGWPPPADISDGAYASTAPLRARLQTGTSGLAVNVSHAAHVAVFEIVPGRGLGLLYPAYGSERGQFSSGYSRIHLNRFRPYTWHFTGGTFDDRAGPRYYLLVASRSPLRLGQFQDDPAALRQHFGFRRFAALNPRPAMAELVDLVVPAQADEDWDTDLLTVWPQEWGGLDDRRTVRVVCENGYVVTTAWDNAGYACGAVNQLPRVPPQRPDTAGGERPDSVKVPGRRRPEPRSTDDEGRARPRDRAIVERWREADDERTPVRRARPGPEEREPWARDGGRREGPGGRRETPQWDSPRSPQGGGIPRTETPRAEPRHEAPRREPPREMPRAEPRREAPRREAPRPSAPATPPARKAPSGETR